MYVLGIDPGLNGAIASLQIKPRLFVSVCTIPNVKMQVGKKSRTRIDMHATWQMIGAFGACDPALVVLEEVGGRPQQSGGVAFGKIAGALEMSCIGHKLPYQTVPPAVWKRALQLNDDKERTRLMATRLFPAFAHLWPLKKHHDRAEAVLLAWYGATKILGAV